MLVLSPHNQVRCAVCMSAERRPCVSAHALMSLGHVSCFHCKVHEWRQGLQEQSSMQCQPSSTGVSAGVLFDMLHLSVCRNVVARRSAMPESWCQRETRQRLWLRLAMQMMAAATRPWPARSRCRSQRRQCSWLCRQPQQRRLHRRHSGSSRRRRRLRASWQATHQHPSSPPRLASRCS
jgi:hypothetical protein